MKTNSEIAHIWANNLEYKGQQGNLFFNANTIYSYGYHFPIARHLDADTVLFTNRSYSNSTSKHIGLVRSAISHKTIIYCNRPDITHSDNINAFILQITTEASKLIKAKKPEIYLQNIEYIKSDLNKYLTYFKIKLTKKQLETIDIKTKEDYTLKLEILKSKENKKIQSAVNKGKKLYPLFLDQFRNGLKSDFTYIEKEFLNTYYTSINSPALFKIENNNLVSNKGIKLPLEIAKKYLDRYFNNTLKAADKITDFVVSKVTKNYIQIGCHYITRSELDYLKQTLR
jgi:hypothetical protein